MAKAKRICHLVLRFLAFGATLSSVIVMATSHERAGFFPVYLEAKYTNTPAFKYVSSASSVIYICISVVIYLSAEFVIFLDT